MTRRSDCESPVLRGVQGAEEPLEAMLRGMLAARGGRAFGVCRTCVHYRSQQAGGWCALLEQPLSVEDSAHICREHSAA